MLRKNSTSSNQKNLGYLQMGDHLKSNAAVLESCGNGENHKNSCFPNVFGGLFVGLNPKGSEMDSIRSPTSPLDFRVFSSLGNPYRSPRAAYNEGCHKTWDRPKVGLGIINSLDDGTNESVKVIQSSIGKNVIQNPQMMMITARKISHHIDPIQVPKSLPKNIAIFPRPQTISSNIQKGKSVVFEIGESQFPVEDSKTTIRACSLDSGWCGPQLINIGNRKSRLSSGNFGSGNKTCTLNFPVQPIKGCFEAGTSAGSNSDPQQPVTDSGTGMLGSLSASEIELSEDYTCVRTRGPNPKITHIFGDCILECHNNELSDSSNNDVESTALPQAANTTSSKIISTFPPDNFLSFCYFCKKKLDGKDIYMYRGEKAFCSSDCRSQELLIDEETEKENSDDSSEDISNLNSQDDLFDSGTFIAM